MRNLLVIVVIGAIAILIFTGILNLSPEGEAALEETQENVGTAVEDAGEAIQDAGE